MLGLSLARSFEKRGHSSDILTIFSGDGSLKQELEGSDLNLFEAEFRGRSISRRFLVPFYLYRLFSREKYDVLHCHHMTVFFHCLRPARLAGIKKIVVTEHAHQHFAGNNKLIWRSRHRGPKADAITVIHNELARFFRQDLGIPEKLVEMIPNGVDTELYSPGKAPPEILQQVDQFGWDTIVGCVSRLHVDKDVPNLLRAFAKVRSRVTGNPGLVIVGAGPDRARVEETIRELGISECVFLAGVRKDIPHWLRLFDLFVLPSRREGVPLAILEAMSCGLPVVATDVGGVSEVVDRSAGFVVPRENPEELAASITSLIEDRDLRSRMSRQARQNVENNFSYDGMIDSYLRVFEARP